MGSGKEEVTLRIFHNDSSTKEITVRKKDAERKKRELLLSSSKIVYVEIQK